MENASWIDMSHLTHASRTKTLKVLKKIFPESGAELAEEFTKWHDEKNKLPIAFPKEDGYESFNFVLLTEWLKEREIDLDNFAKLYRPKRFVRNKDPKSKPKTTTGARIRLAKVKAIIDLGSLNAEELDHEISRIYKD